jgi:hypothetical protein
VQDLLAMELRQSHKELPFPDRITVHRKGIPGQEDDEALAQELRCFPNTPQVLVHNRSTLPLSVLADVVEAADCQAVGHTLAGARKLQCSSCCAVAMASRVRSGSSSTCASVAARSGGAVEADSAEGARQVPCGAAAGECDVGAQAQASAGHAAARPPPAVPPAHHALPRLPPCLAHR